MISFHFKMQAHKVCIHTESFACPGYAQSLLLYLGVLVLFSTEVLRTWMHIPQTSMADQVVSALEHLPNHRKMHQQRLQCH